MSLVKYCLHILELHALLALVSSGVCKPVVDFTYHMTTGRITLPGLTN